MLRDPADKARHDKMVALVERMLELNKLKHSGGHPRHAGTGRPPLQPEQIERGIAATDTEIEELAHKLFGITDEGRRIVEHS